MENFSENIADCQDKKPTTLFWKNRQSTIFYSNDLRNFFQKISRFALDFSTLIFALILRVANFLCKSVQSAVNLCKKVLKNAKKRKKVLIFAILPFCT